MEVSQRALLGELSGGVFPLGVLQACPKVPCKLFTKSARVCSVFNSLHCPRGVHSCICREEVFIGFRGLAKPYSTDKSRVCSTVPDSVSNLSTGRHGHTEQSCLRELHHLLSSNHPACLTNHGHGGCHFYRETCFQLETQTSNLTFHYVLCSPICTDALSAESR